MNFLNLHILRSMPMSNTNADDTGAPKSVVNGSVPRGRNSSQARKRHVRVAFELDSPAETTYRSKQLPTLVTNRAIGLLAEQDVEVDDPTRTKIEKALAKKLGELTSGAEDKKATLLWVEEAEVAEMVAKVVAHHTDIELAAKDIVGGQTRSLSIAAFGRFFANSPQSGIDAAIQVAHSMTTHRRQSELDYFTAVDDLSASFGDHKGAGHLDVAEFTSGVFYEFCALDVRQLLHNWADRDADDAAARLQQLIKALILTIPGGKKNSTAPMTVPALILAVGSSQPLSYASAFERPVPESDDGFEQASVLRLIDYHAKVAALDPELTATDWRSGMGIADPLPLDAVTSSIAAAALTR